MHACSAVNFYQPGTRKARARLVLRLLYVFVSVCFERLLGEEKQMAQGTGQLLYESKPETFNFHLSLRYSQVRIHVVI